MPIRIEDIPVVPVQEEVSYTEPEVACEDVDLSELSKIPLMQYFKTPARTMLELYSRYPEGGERGWFTIITNLNAIALWDDRGKAWLTTPYLTLEQINNINSIAEKADKTFVSVSVGQLITENVTIVDEGDGVYSVEDTFDDVSLYDGYNIIAVLGQTDEDEIAIYKKTSEEGNISYLEKLYDGIEVNIVRNNGNLFEDAGVWVSLYDGYDIASLSFLKLNENQGGDKLSYGVISSYADFTAIVAAQKWGVYQFGANAKLRGNGNEPSGDEPYLSWLITFIEILPKLNYPELGYRVWTSQVSDVPNMPYYDAECTIEEYDGDGNGFAFWATEIKRISLTDIQIDKIENSTSRFEAIYSMSSELPSYTEEGGVLTAVDNGALSVDAGSGVGNNQTVFVAYLNKVYTITNKGSISTKWVLTEHTASNGYDIITTKLYPYTYILINGTYQRLQSALSEQQLTNISEVPNKLNKGVINSYQDYLDIVAEGKDGDYIIACGADIDWYDTHSLPDGNGTVPAVLRIRFNEGDDSSTNTVLSQAIFYSNNTKVESKYAFYAVCSVIESQGYYPIKLEGIVLISPFGTSIKDVLGISAEGSATKFLNEQGDFVASGGGIAGVQKNGVDLTPDVNNKVNITVPTQPSDIGAAASIHTHGGQSINPDNVILNKTYTDIEAASLSIGTIFYNSDQNDWLLKTSADTYSNINGELTPLMKNGDSVTHLNGQPVYFFGGTGKLPVVKLANSASFTSGYTIALATQDVVNTGNGRGRYCAIGGVNGVPISNVIKTGESDTTWVENAKLYLANEAGKLTTVENGFYVGIITDKSGANISIFCHPQLPLAADLTSNSASIAPSVKAVNDGLAGKQAALGFTPENSANKGQANGYGSLGASGRQPITESPTKILSRTTYEGVWYDATAVASTNVITCPSITFANNSVVEVRNNTGIVPGGLSEYNNDAIGTYYNVINASGNTCKVSYISGGAEIDLTTDGTAGWQIRVCPLYVDVTIPALATYERVELHMSLLTGKLTTTSSALVARFNNDANAVVTNGVADPSSYPQLTVGYGWGATQRYHNAEMRFVLTRISSTSILVGYTYAGKHSADKVTWTNVVQAPSGNSVSTISSLAAEVTSVRLYANNPSNQIHGAIRSLTVTVIQM